MSYEVLVIIVMVNVAVTVSLWRALGRKANRPPGLKKKFAKQLWRGEPIEPKHERPKVIGDNYPSLASDADRRFFADFADFADIINYDLADEFTQSPWRLQELPTTQLMINNSDSPNFGRRYALFYNQTRLGEFEISPHYEYTTEAPKVRAEIKIRWVRLLHVDAVTDVLRAISTLVTDPRPNSAEYVAAHQTIHLALTRALWDAVEVSEFADLDGTGWGELELQLNGSAEWYIKRMHNWRRTRSEESIKAIA